MNWKQLHTAANDHERREAITLMLRAIEARKYTISERRRRTIAHFIRDRRSIQLPLSIYAFQMGRGRGRGLTRERIIRLVNYAFILYTVSAAVLVVTFHAPIQLATPMLALYTAYLWYIVLAPIVRTVRQYATQ